MDPIRVAALIGFIAVAGLVTYVALRSREAGRRSRGSRAFRDGVASIAARADETLARALVVADDLRHHRVGPGTAAAALDAAAGAASALADEAAALATPPGATAVRDGLVAGLHRAAEALGRITAGCGRLVAATGPDEDPEGRDEVRRGYLDLQHARESIAARAAEVARSATA